MNKSEIQKLLEERSKDQANNYFVMGFNLTPDKYLPMAYEAGVNLLLPLLVEALEGMECKYIPATSTAGFSYNHSHACRKCQLIQKIKEL